MVPTATLPLLYVLLVVRHERRISVYWNITESPTTEWTAQRVVEELAFDAVPQYLLRDRYAIYEGSLVRRVEGLGIQEKVIAPTSPWQNPIVERVIRSIRGECLDRVIVLNERHLRRILAYYCDYYHNARTHSTGRWARIHPILEHRGAGGWQDHRTSNGWRAPSPLRPARRLMRAGSRS